MHELPFYIELSKKQILKEFKWYAKSYRIEIIDTKYYLRQLKASKSSIKDVFKDLLDKIKTLHTKWNFPLRISSVNVTKSAVSCRVNNFYWRNP